MKVFWQVFVIFSTALIGTLTLFAPKFLAENEFLKAFVGHELLAFLVVVLTITLGSVANIHLSIARTQTEIQDADTRKKIEEQFAKPLKLETQSSAWMLFWAMVVIVVALVIRGAVPQSEYVSSVVHGVAITVLILNGVVLYDIYSTIFELIGLSHGDT